MGRKNNYEKLLPKVEDLYYNKNKTVNEVAKSCKISSQTVRNYLRKSNGDNWSRKAMEFPVEKTPSYELSDAVFFKDIYNRLRDVYNKITGK